MKCKSWTARTTAAVYIWFIALVMTCFYLDVHETEKISIDWPDSDDYNGMSSHLTACKILNTKCSWCRKTQKVLDFSQFTLAIIFFTCMYWRIIYTLTTRSGRFQSERDSDKQTTSMMFRARNQIARMLILNGTVFFLCLAPFQVFYLDLFFYWWAGFKIFGEETKRYILWLGRVAMLLNSAINPLLYNISNKRYRDTFAEAFGCTRKKKPINSNCKSVSTQVEK